MPSLDEAVDLFERRLTAWLAEDLDAYLELWSPGESQERPGTAREVADAVAADIESRFPQFIGQAFTR